MAQHIDYVGIQIGVAGQLDRKALRTAIRNTQKVIANVAPTTAIDIAIGGYDEDPREIYEIPEARRFVLGYAVGLTKAGIPLERLLPVSVHLIRLCVGAERGQKIILTDKPEIDIGEQLKAHRERARRSMN